MKSRYGRVYIVGAGPGDPGLMTLKGLEKLKQADVVVYDRLINNDLLSYCRKDCEKIFVGKESGFHPVEQERITEILINKSKPGTIVVRLKGGNPFVFGRGSEEAMALKKAGIDFEIIPGITSGLAAPIYSGIPITQRGMITSCVLITAHESPGKEQTQVEWEKLAKLKNTSLIIYMGASRIQVICQELVKHGLDPSTPVAAIENGTLPKQRTVTGRLDSIAEEFKRQDFHAPAIIIISPTVSLRDQISWYEKKPLFGKRVVAAADGEEMEELHEMLRDLGGEVLLLPSSDGTAIPGLLPGNGHGAEEDILETGESSSYDILSGELNNGAVLAKTVHNTSSHEPETELIRDIEENGADIFVFAASSAVEHFFDALGYEAAAKLLEHGTSIATNDAAASALTDKNIRNIKTTTDNTSKGIYDLLFNLFSQTSPSVTVEHI